MSGLRRTENGIVTLTDPGADRPILEVATVRCCHCGGHWVPKSGSGIERGWCQNCAGPVCSKACAKCVPWEQMLSNIEAGRPADYRPIIVPAGG